MRKREREQVVKGRKGEADSMWGKVKASLENNGIGTAACIYIYMANVTSLVNTIQYRGRRANILAVFHFLPPAFRFLSLPSSAFVVLVTRLDTRWRCRSRIGRQRALPSPSSGRDPVFKSGSAVRSSRAVSQKPRGISSRFPASPPPPTLIIFSF